MASDYGRNFGFRISDESRRISDGRYKTPAGSALKIGTAVAIDHAEAGYLKAADADAVLQPGSTGLLVSEEVWDRSLYEAQVVDSFQLGVAKADRLAVITSGAGVKIWLKNTAAQTRADGRVIAAVTMVDLTGIAAGDQIGWDGTTFAKVDGVGVNEAWANVVEVSASGVEAVLIA